jgi:hypothetical protein
VSAKNPHQACSGNSGRPLAAYVGLDFCRTCRTCRTSEDSGRQGTEWRGPLGIQSGGSKRSLEGPTEVPQAKRPTLLPLEERVLGSTVSGRDRGATALGRPPSQGPASSTCDGGRLCGVAPIANGTPLPRADRTSPGREGPPGNSSGTAGPQRAGTTGHRVADSGPMGDAGPKEEKENAGWAGRGGAPGRRCGPVGVGGGDAGRKPKSSVTYKEELKRALGSRFGEMQVLSPVCSDFLALLGVAHED